jgi:vanillate O-demethylase monooxygenase subunit
MANEVNEIFKTYVENTWWCLGLSADFPKEKLTGHVICDRPLVAWRTKAGEVVVYDDRCAHKRFPLSRGRLMPDGTLECGYHGMRYDTSGKCVMIPSHPTGPISPAAVMTAYPVMEQDGVIWIWPGDPNKTHLRNPPRLPEVASDRYENNSIGPLEIQSNYFLLLENVIDITHFYPLHDGNIGDTGTSKITPEFSEGEIDGYKWVRVLRRVQNYKQSPYYMDWFHYDVVDRHNSQQILSPGCVRVDQRCWPAGQELVDEVERGYSLYHLITPVTVKKFLWRVVLNAPVGHMSMGDPTVSTCKRIAAMFPKVAEEDRFALEVQQPMMEYPERGYQEVFLKPDIGIRAYRQVVLDMMREEGKLPSSQPNAGSSYQTVAAE